MTAAATHPKSGDADHGVARVPAAAVVLGAVSAHPLAAFGPEERWSR